MEIATHVSRRDAAAVLLAALASLVFLVASAPDYLLDRGFPLDDAWIHAVYARSLARDGVFAYNPGVPAAGATSTLWATVLALPQLLTRSDLGVIVLTKLLGFGLHVGSSFLLFALLSRAPLKREIRLASAILFAIDPDLVAASVSGMEVSLAIACALGLALVVDRDRPLAVAALALLASLARPEMAMVAILVPLVTWRLRGGRPAATLAAGAGALSAFAVVAIRNRLHGLRPLPTPFYVKTQRLDLSLFTKEWRGFGQLLGGLSTPRALLPLLVAVVFSVVVARKKRDGAALVALAISGAAYCAVSFALQEVRYPEAFYFQRYSLPGLALTLAVALPLFSLAVESSRAQRALVVVLALAYLISSPSRYRRLENDARNIDDVQVRIGRLLASAKPEEVVWTIDAGAIRYFGNAFVVDIVGLNTPEMAARDPSAFLAHRSPRYLDFVGGVWNPDAASFQRLPKRFFEASPPFTISPALEMATHCVALCVPGAQGGTVIGLGRVLRYSCAPSGP